MIVATSNVCITSTDADAVKVPLPFRQSEADLQQLSTTALWLVIIAQHQLSVCFPLIAEQGCIGRAHLFNAGEKSKKIKQSKSLNVNIHLKSILEIVPCHFTFLAMLISVTFTGFR